MRFNRRPYLLIGIAFLLAWLGSRMPEPAQIVEAHAARGATAMLGAGSAPSLPLRIERPMLPPAANDPFTLVPPPAPPAPKQSQQLSAAHPPPPPPPPVNLSFSGRITTPEGKEVIYLAYGDVSMPIAVGQTLPNGYKVDAITEKSVELSYPSLNVSTRLELPQPPQYEIR